MAAALVSALTLPPAACAETPADFMRWLDELRQEALSQGISPATFDDALAEVETLDRVVELDRRQPEFTQTFWLYIDARVTPERVARGQKLLQQHRALLDEVGARYGVPPRIIVAFWGLETDYGRHLGRVPTLTALATLAYDARRSAFFRSELLDALRIVDAGSVGPDDMTGSWAGAMGHLQFMPSTYVRHAVDGDGDGHRDLWRSLPDAFASAANYLANIGWQGTETWGREVQVPVTLDWSLADPTVWKPLAEWAALGLRQADGTALPRATLRARLLLPQGHRGPAFLVYGNFETILAWNRSINYALAVGHLADRLADMPELRTGREAPNTPLSRDQAIEIQALLNRAGYEVGEPDGLPGPRTQAAVRAYQRAVGLPADGYPSAQLLETLRVRQAITEPQPAG